MNPWLKFDCENLLLHQSEFIDRVDFKAAPWRELYSVFLGSADRRVINDAVSLTRDASEKLNTMMIPLT
jgi:hypothetical protein